MKNYMTLLLAAAFAVGSTFSSQAGSSFKKDVPLTLHMDINNRQTPVYDGYTSYVMGNRTCEMIHLLLQKYRPGRSGRCDLELLSDHL